MGYKEVLSAAAIVLTLFAFLPFIRSILRGTVRPHMFSWIIWGITTFITFLAQLADRGGAGAWPIGVSGSITLFVALLAFLKRGDVTVTRSDWAFFAAALSSLPLWYFTSDPLWAVLILTAVDLLGFGPTLRKAYHLPFEEDLLFYALFLVRNLLVIPALENHTLTTVMFPAVISLSCFALIVLIATRRRVQRASLPGKRP